MITVLVNQVLLPPWLRCEYYLSKSSSQPGNSIVSLLSLLLWEPGKLSQMIPKLKSKPSEKENETGTFTGLPSNRPRLTA